MIRRIAILLALWAGTAQAQGSTAEAALAAKARLEAAQAQLDAAYDSRDRIAALTATVRAYEDGLVAMRDGVRRAALREERLTRAMDAKSDEVARLLGALQSMGRAPAPLLLLHPSGPAGTARSGMIVSSVTPGLQSQVDILRDELTEIAALRAVQDQAADTLRQGLDGAQKARTALAAAMDQRTDLPMRAADDPVQTALLIASAETLDDFANGLAQTAAAPELPGADDLRGTLTPPVAGVVIQRFGEQGPERAEGTALATRARSLVNVPVSSTLRFKGPLLNYGTVAILEPAVGVLIVFAGMGEVFGTVGEIMPQGAPLGLMGGTPPDVDGILTTDAGVARPETLYIEVRENGVPVDPASWFVLD